MTTMRELSETVRDQGEELERLREELARWRERYDRGDKRDIGFTNSSGEVDPLFTALKSLVDKLAWAYLPLTSGMGTLSILVWCFYRIDRTQHERKCTLSLPQFELS